ncbi:hypothetical protein H4V95_002266 [Arthrobacter sp. CAN_C5]|nr:hypothetical protein [Arthrobacter sp. CAN_C5]
MITIFPKMPTLCAVLQSFTNLMHGIDRDEDWNDPVLINKPNHIFKDVPGSGFDAV